MAGSASIAWLHDGNEPVILDYTEITASVTVISTTEGSPTTIITGGAVSLDGGTRIKITFYCEELVASITGTVYLQLWDGGTDIGKIAGLEVATSQGVPCLVQRVITPSNASHTYSIRAYMDSGTDAAVLADAGGVGTKMPAFLLIETAP